MSLQNIKISKNILFEEGIKHFSMTYILIAIEITHIRNKANVIIDERELGLRRRASVKRLAIGSVDLFYAPRKTRGRVVVSAAGFSSRSCHDTTERAIEIDR